MIDSNENKLYQLDEEKLRESLNATPLAPWTDALITAVNSRGEKLVQGQLPKWQAALDALPNLDIAKVDLDHETGVAALTAEDVVADEMKKAATEAEVAPGSEPDADADADVELDADAYADADADDTSNTINAATQPLELALKELMPWRKGPFRIADVTINTEWRSDWKWNRVYPHITPLDNRTVLDVGCGSGYHMWRMRSHGASCVLGIDPSILFQMQFHAMQKYIDDPKVAMLPLTMEAMPENMHCFDTTFSMGVLYHRKEPHTHLKELMDSLRAGGELILETLVALGEEESELLIEERYARMRNIWSLPSVPLLARWMHEAGFKNIRCVSVDITSQLEQRTTEWMQFESLRESLDSENPALTVEGLPRPRRAVMIAQKPDQSQT